MNLLTQHSLSQTDECQADSHSELASQESQPAARKACSVDKWSNCRNEAPNILLDEGITFDPSMM